MGSSQPSGPAMVAAAADADPVTPSAAQGSTAAAELGGPAQAVQPAAAR